MNSFTYADDSSWEDWQKEYKYGAFYIFPPTGIIEQIDELRKTYDSKSASYSQAHISLSESLRNPLSEEQLKELETALSKLETFTIHFGPLRSFPPNPGVTYAISPEDKFMQLRSVAHTTSLFNGVELKHKDVAPHMTIAEFISLEDTAKLLGKLKGNVPEGDFLCDHIEYRVPNKDFYFEQVLIIPFGTKK